MFQYHQGQGLNAPSGSPLRQAIVTSISSFGKNLICSGASQWQASQVAQQLNSMIDQLEYVICQNSPGGSTSSQVIYQVVTHFGQQILNQMQNGGMPGMNNNIQQGTMMGQNQNFQTGGGISFRKESEAPSVPVFQNSPPKVVKESPAAELPTPTAPGELKQAIPASPPHDYVPTDDPKASVTYSTKCPSGEIIEVVSKLTIKEDTGDIYNYNNVINYIPEPSIGRCINSFVRTNDKLLVGKWITFMGYSVFDLRNMKVRKCDDIDISALDDKKLKELPTEVAVRKVLDSISDRDHSIVTVLESAIVAKVNDRLERYCRLSSTADFNRILEIQTLNDIADLPGLRNRHFGNITFHENYEATIVRCIKSALVEVVTKFAPKGFWVTEEIAPHLLAHPKFVIRENGFCDREMDLSNPDFVTAIKTRYTAFNSIGEVAFTNFIPGEPGELETDLDGNAIMIERPTNILEYMITRVWKHLPEIILMKEGSDSLLIKVGKTMDTGQLFYYRSTTNLYHGER